MSYFNLNHKKITLNFANFFKEEMKETYTLEDIKKFSFSNPIYLSSNSIKIILEKLNKDKQLFVNFIASYDTLTDKVKMSALNHFCPLVSNYESLLQKLYPKKKVIKSSLYIGTTFCQFKALANVYTKKGVKLNLLKTYKLKEIENLISSGKILIKDFDTFGKIRYKKSIDFWGYTNNLLDINLKVPQISKDGVLLVNANANAIVKNLLETISVQELNNFYKITYLTQYKNCLNYLNCCIDYSIEQENINLQYMNEQIIEIPKKIEENENSKKEIDKLISDGGRE